MTFSYQKTLAGIALATAVGLGTFKGTEGIPFVYNNRTENGNGIQVGLANVNHAKFSGIQLGLFNRNYGTVNGINVGIIANTSVNSTINGIELSVICNCPRETDKESARINGLQASIAGNAAIQRSYGLQVGIFNGVAVQNRAGIYQWNPIFNVLNGYNPNEDKK